MKAKYDDFVILEIDSQRSCLEVQKRYGIPVVESPRVPTKRLVLQMHVRVPFEQSMRVNLRSSTIGSCFS